MTQRQTLKSQILDIVRDNRASAIPQHVLIAGNEGMGKTFMIAELATELALGGEKVTQLFYPHCDIVTVDDITSRVDAALNVQSVILIDDFDTMLPSLPNEEQYKFRSFLFRKGAPMLIATSTGVFEGFSDYRAPFYDAFRVFFIPSLEADDLPNVMPHEVFEHVRDNQEFLLLWPKLGNNINYIRSLAFGIHTGLSVDDALNQVVNENSRFFRQLFSSLPAMQQRALYALAQAIDSMGEADSDDERAATSSQVQHQSGLTPANTASALFRLEKQGIIGRIGEKKRNVSYQIKDYVFEMWLR